MRTYLLKLGYRSEKGRNRLETVVVPALRIACEEVNTQDGAAFVVLDDYKSAVEEFLQSVELYQDVELPREWIALFEGREEVNHA